MAIGTMGSKQAEEESLFYSTRLQSCRFSFAGKSIHAAVHKKSYFSNPVFLQNHLLNMYFNCHDIASARQLFDEMPDRNVVTWSSAISGFVRCGAPQSGLSCYIRMQRLGVRPNQFTLLAMLNASSSTRSWRSMVTGLTLTLADQVYSHVLRHGYASNVYLLNAFLTAKIRNGKLEEAVDFFEDAFTVARRDVVTWNSMLAGLLDLSCAQVWMFWCRMIGEGVKPNEFTFSTVLTGLARIESQDKTGLATHGRLVKCGHGDDMCVGNSLMDMYLSKQQTQQAVLDGSKVFDEMGARNVISWTQMASGLFRSGQPTNALRHVNTMMQMGIMPNRFTLALIFNVAATLVSLEQGLKFHGVKIKLGRHEIDDCVDNTLIDMYTKCGSMDGASKVFWSMEPSERSVITWTTMIMGFAQNGLAEQALKLFAEMLLVRQPNNITFICVLYACSQGGFVDQGWRYFSSMQSDHDIVPEEDHYACMVDLLGRAGHIADAEALIRTMPFRPRALLWQTLLGACRIHGDVETGERAAEQAIVLDHQDHTTYILLSNIFATSRHWDGVGRVRKMIAERHVQRIHGRSWTEVIG